jgi:hypothetical protein
MQTATLTLKTTDDLVKLNTSIGNAMERAARVGNTEAMQSLLRDRRRVRAELEARKAAARN